MNKYCIEISQNGWEYTGYTWITCNKISKTGDKTVLIDGKYEIKFDEEIKEPYKIDDDNEEYNFTGYIHK